MRMTKASPAAARRSDSASLDAAAVTVVAHERLAFGSRAHLFQALGGAETTVGRARGDELRDLGLVDLAAFRLPVGSARTAHVRPFIPAHAHPAQGAQDGRLGIRRRARPIRVLDAQDELAAVLLGKDVVEEGDIGGPYVGIAGGRWSDANTNRHDGCHKSAVGMRQSRGNGEMASVTPKKAALPATYRRTLGRLMQPSEHRTV